MQPGETEVKESAMLTPRLNELHENEILKYLGYRGQEIDENLRQQIERCIREVSRASVPRIVWKRLPVENSHVDGLTLAGRDMANLLDHCQEVVLLGATIGAMVERLLMRYEVKSMSDALIMDACASTAVENVCNNFESDLRAEVEQQGKYLSDRFSPGYGDLPFSENPDFCALLNVEKRIGVTQSPTHLMIPRKSVMAIMGISDHPLKMRGKGCENCPMFRNCRFRKKGVTCTGEPL